VNNYMVIGVCAENPEDRYADMFLGETWQDAEWSAMEWYEQENGDHLLVAAVLLNGVIVG
jgi:hypothetical protein